MGISSEDEWEEIRSPVSSTYLSSFKSRRRLNKKKSPNNTPLRSNKSLKKRVTVSRFGCETSPAGSAKSKINESPKSSNESKTTKTSKSEHYNSIKSSSSLTSNRATSQSPTKFHPTETVVPIAPDTCAYKDRTPNYSDAGLDTDGLTNELHVQDDSNNKLHNTKIKKQKKLSYKDVLMKNVLRDESNNKLHNTKIKKQKKLSDKDVLMKNVLQDDSNNKLHNT